MFILRWRSLSYSNIIRLNYGIHISQLGRVKIVNRTKSGFMCQACIIRILRELKAVVSAYHNTFVFICLKTSNSSCFQETIITKHCFVHLSCHFVTSKHKKSLKKQSVNITLVAHLFPLNSDNFILYNIIHKKRDNQT